MEFIQIAGHVKLPNTGIGVQALNRLQNAIRKTRHTTGHANTFATVDDDAKTFTLEVNIDCLVGDGHLIREALKQISDVVVEGSTIDTKDGVPDDPWNLWAKLSIKE